MSKKDTHNNSLATVFGTKLAELRKSHQMTQADLAQAMGVSRSMINYYENWATNPTLEAVEKAARVFKVDASTLLINLESKQKKSGPPNRLEKLITKIQTLSSFKQKMLIDMIEGALK